MPKLSPSFPPRPAMCCVRNGASTRRSPTRLMRRALPLAAPPESRHPLQGPRGKARPFHTRCVALPLPLRSKTAREGDTHGSSPLRQWRASPPPSTEPPSPAKRAAPSFASSQAGSTRKLLAIATTGLSQDPLLGNVAGNVASLAILLSGGERL